MLSAAGFDGHIDIFSIMGGSSQAQSRRHADQVTSNLLGLHSIIISGLVKNFTSFARPSNMDVFYLMQLLPLFCLSKLTSLSPSQISNSFGNMDPFGTGQALPPLQLPQTVAPTATSVPLKKPPKWIRRPVGATFAVSPVLMLPFSLSLPTSV